MFKVYNLAILCCLPKFKIKTPRNFLFIAHVYHQENILPQTHHKAEFISYIRCFLVTRLKKMGMVVSDVRYNGSPGTNDHRLCPNQELGARGKPETLNQVSPGASSEAAQKWTCCLTEVASKNMCLSLHSVGYLRLKRQCS